MQILNDLFYLGTHIVCFIAGLLLANSYNEKARREIKDALERQFLRLQTKSDADDPCRPYIAPAEYRSPISQEFMDELHENGFAKTSFRKSDLS